MTFAMGWPLASTRHYHGYSLPNSYAADCELLGLETAQKLATFHPSTYAPVLPVSPSTHHSSLARRFYGKKSFRKAFAHEKGPP
ncbi:hypothetical protein ACFSHV_19450 [Paracidovorax cattleyae]|uniref:hypothetical protein n=1 Tax=Paracidovorax cattleyae TaxID=80868 RepID=UPI00126035EC|nr:hypothetical protein [Paracidovorax cattleyae]